MVSLASQRRASFSKGERTDETEVSRQCQKKRRPMSCPLNAAVTAGPLLLLGISELLPLIRRYTGFSLTPNGILDFLFILAFCAWNSGCIKENYLGRVERALGRDINGDGIIGSPAHSSSSQAAALPDEPSATAGMTSTASSTPPITESLSRATSNVIPEANALTINSVSAS